MYLTDVENFFNLYMYLFLSLLYGTQVYFFPSCSGNLPVMFPSQLYRQSAGYITSASILSFKVIFFAII